MLSDGPATASAAYSDHAAATATAARRANGRSVAATPAASTAKNGSAGST
jgi:hypothetical protein